MPMKWLLIIVSVAVLAATQIQASVGSSSPECTTNPTEFVVLPDGTEAMVSSIACEQS